MKTWYTFEANYWNIKDTLNDLEKQGYKIFWLSNPAGTCMMQVVCYKETV